MKISKKDIISCFFLLILICSFILWGIIQVVFKTQPEIKVAIETSGISQFDFALSTLGKHLTDDKVAKYNTMVKEENQIDYSKVKTEAYLEVWKIMLAPGLFITILISGIYFAIRNKVVTKIKIKQEALRNNNYLKKYSLSGKEMRVKCIDGTIVNNQIINNMLITWTINDTLYFINNDYHNDFGIFEIQYDDIISYSRYGDFYTGTKIKGGGSSLGMGALGYLIAGTAGAIVASRNPISSETIVHDKRETLVFVKENNEEKYIFFDPCLYDALMHILPMKEIDMIYKREKINENTIDRSDKIEKIKRIGELRDNGYIDDAEFNKLKSEINI